MSLFLISFRLASRALARNTLRTVLTMLGMIIGVGAVVTMAALGNGAQQSVETDVRSAGTNLVQVRAGNFTRGGEDSNIASGLGAATTLVIDDADAIRKEISGLKRVAEIVRLRAWVASGGKRFYAQIAGTGADLPPIYGWPLAGGRFYDARDVAARARVALAGATVQDRLFEPSGGVGSTVTIRDQPFKVIGLPRTADEDQNETVYVPFTALQDILTVTYLHGITIEAEQSGDATRVAADVTALLRRRHAAHIEAANASVARLRQGGILGNQMPQGGGPSALAPPDDFTVKTQAAEALTKGLYTSVAAFVLANMPKLDEVNMQEMASTLQRAGTTMTALLAGIAAISLIVGGIGIMNIMLVAVTERTREIGIRRAVGARSRDVRLQFLVEAVTLAMAGGAIGLVAGLASSAIMTWLLEWPTSVSASSIVLAFGIAAAVGVFFGFYPAQRASRLTPIDALRHE